MKIRGGDQDDHWLPPFFIPAAPAKMVKGVNFHTNALPFGKTPRFGGVFRAVLRAGFFPQFPMKRF